MKKLLLALALLLLAPAGAWAANCATDAYASTPGTFPTSSTATFTATSGGTACTFVSGNILHFDGNTAAGSYTLNASTSIAGLTSSGASASVFFLHGSGDTLTVNDGTTSTTFDISHISYCNANPCTTPVTAARAISFTNTGGTVSITTGSSTSSPYNQLGTVTFNGAGGTFELLDNANFQNVPTATAGTLDATTNNTSPTLGSAAGTQTLTVPSGFTLNCGTGTWTFSSTVAVVVFSTGSTISCASATFSFPNASSAFDATRELNLSLNNVTLGTLSIADAGASGPTSFLIAGTGSNTETIGTFNISVTHAIFFSLPAMTITLTNAPTWNGSSGNFITFIGFLQSNSQFTVSAAPTISWAAFCSIKFSTSFTATNSLQLCPISGFVISPPSFGGGGNIIGGGL